MREVVADRTRGHGDVPRPPLVGAPPVARVPSEGNTIPTFRRQIDAILVVLLSPCSAAAPAPVAAARWLTARTSHGSPNASRVKSPKTGSRSDCHVDRASEQVSRDAAQEAVARATQDALASLRAEVAITHERAGCSEIAAATRAARESVQPRRRGRGRAQVGGDRGRRRASGGTRKRPCDGGAGGAADGRFGQVDDGGTSRRISRRRARTCRTSRGRPPRPRQSPWPTAARSVAEQLVRVTLAAVHEDETAMRAEWSVGDCDGRADHARAD